MKKVLFVCGYNSGRSQIAEASFNQLDRGQAEAFKLSEETIDYELARIQQGRKV